MSYIVQTFYFIGRYSLESIVRKAEIFASEFTEQLYKLIPHQFIATNQSKFFHDLQFNLKRNEMIAICDFAENYSFVVQDAIQSFHWSNDQCTIHPFCLYFRDEDDQLQCKSLIVIAESLKHDVNAVHLFQHKLISIIRIHYSFVKNIIFFSDGAASQYKNRKNLYNICQFKRKFDLQAEWHFFATSHGKSACDALGGSFKREAAKTSLKQPVDVITNAKKLFEWAQARKTKTLFVFCSNTEYEEEANRSKNRYDKVKTITGTQSLHSFQPINENEILARKFSYDLHSQTFTLKSQL